MGSVSYTITSAITVSIYSINAKVTNLTNIYLGSNDECPTTTVINILTNSVQNYYIPYSIKTILPVNPFKTKETCTDAVFTY
jgi:hypothetical protein